ncbi:MAG: hypothetical protein ACP5E3_08415 [Bacteroidales bacterium]
MKKFLLLYLLFQFLHPLSSLSQEVISSEIGDILIEILGEESENLAEVEELYELLSDIYLRKENINFVSREELNKIPFLTEFQVFSFLEYRKKYGWIYSPNELCLITGFHKELIEKMILFFSFQHPLLPTDSEIKGERKINQKLLIRTKFEYPLRAGFSDNIDSSQNFQGTPVYRLLKYEMEKKERFRLGITMESDAGEEFVFDSLFNGFNFNSFYGEIKDRGIIKKVILGDFKLHSAEGLIFSYGRGGKTSANTFRRNIPELKKYSSSAEYGYYRGIGLQAGLKGFQVLSFYSIVRNSGNVYQNPDSSSYFRSLYTNGLFRNKKEIQKRHSITENTAGLVLAYASEYFQAGYNFKISGFKPKIEYLKMGDPYSGSTQSSMIYWQSLFYNFQQGKVLLSGEMAFKNRGGSAFQQKISFFAHPLLTMNFSYRNFSPKYYCPGSTGFAEGGDTRNERGFYTGLIAYPVSFLKLEVYLDQYWFPWIDYRSSFPIKGTELLIDTDWYIHDKLDLRIYCKLEKKYKKILNEDSPVSQMMRTSSVRIYGQFSWEISSDLSSRSRLEIKFYKDPYDKKMGNLLYQEFTRSFPNISSKINIRYTLFDIPDWEVRIYAWEHDLLYAFSSPAYYKTGYNFFLNFRYKAGKTLNLGMKFSTTGYTSLREAGSGSDSRSSRNFLEIKAQCILKI